MIKKMNHRCLLICPAIIAAGAFLSGCNFMHDDLPECATRPDVHTGVKFIYDYNTVEQDLFAEDIGSVTLYLFDSDGNFHSQYERYILAGDNLQQEGFSIPLDLQPGEYKAYAIAQGHHGNYESSLNFPGAKFRRTSISDGDKADYLKISLDHDNGIVNHNNVMLDTLWTTLSAREISVPEVTDPKEGDPQQPDINIEAVIPLMRVTNRLHITFYQEDFPTAINPDNYEVWIASSRGRDTINILGEYADDATPLRFNPFNIETSDDQKGNKCVDATFGLPRFIADDDDDNMTKLYIRNKATGNLTVINHIEQLIAQGREAYPTKSWTAQEYLDREYDYNLAICLTDTTWKFISINISVLSWSKRIQNVAL